MKSVLSWDEWMHPFNFLDIIARRANKATTCLPRDPKYDMFPFYRNGELSFKVLSVTVYNGQMFKPFSPFYETMNSKIDQLITGGMMPKFDFNPIKIKYDEIGPQILTFEQLSLGFAACAICLVIAFVVFLCEYFQPKIKMFVVRITIFTMLKRFYGSRRY